jgi:hypothetical protein
MDKERMLFCVLHHPMDAEAVEVYIGGLMHYWQANRGTQHPTCRIKIREAIQWGSGGWEAECTPPGLLLRYF